MMAAVHAGERAGLNMETFLAQVTAGPISSPIVKGKAPRMIARDYQDTHFSLRWMHKDATYALRAADELRIALPTVAVAREVFQMARGLGLDEADFSAVIEALRKK